MNPITGYTAHIMGIKAGHTVLVAPQDSGPDHWLLFEGPMPEKANSATIGALRHVATFIELVSKPHHIDGNAFIAALNDIANLPTMPRPNKPIGVARPATGDYAHVR